ncbi:hypothetical protein N2152v2_000831 [Parachlorella kessleri]
MCGHICCQIRPRAPRVLAASVAATATKRAVVILPGLGNNSKDYAGLASQLATKGLHVEVASVRRIDWARNAAGLTDINYWRGTLKPRPTVDWYLQRVGAALESAQRATDGAGVTLLAHSAGGWLGRVFMLEFGTAPYNIDQFVSLGSPHLPPPPGTIDQTRGILSWVQDACPGAYQPRVQYITVAGRYIQGATLLGGDGTWQQRVVGAGYQQVCGDATVWGDGVVPVPSAHLEGAEQLTLEGVYHSPLGASDGPQLQDGFLQDSSGSSSSSDGSLQSEDWIKVPVGAQGATGLIPGAELEQELEAAASIQPQRKWYGSINVLDQWVDRVLSPSPAFTDV